MLSQLQAALEFSNSESHEMKLLYAAAIHDIKTVKSDDFYENTALEKVLMVLNMYESSIKAGDLKTYEEILQLPDKPQ